LGTPARCDRQEAARPGGQGGPAAPEPAAVQKRITPARARGRLAARHSEALLRAVALECARLGDRLVQLLAEARTARQESRPPWRSTFIHSSLGRSRKVSSGSMVGARKSGHIATTRSRSPAVARDPAGVRRFRCAHIRVTHFLTALTPAHRHSGTLTTPAHRHPASTTPRECKPSLTVADTSSSATRRPYVIFACL